MKTQLRLPRSVYLFYGIGVSYALVDQIFNQWVLYFYLPPTNSGLQPLLSPLFIALALMISRLVDMVADPVIGYLSDKIRTPLGRKTPFILGGAIPLGICTIAFFYPPVSESGVGTFWYLALVGSLYFIFYTIVGAPYCAMIPEISQTQEERLNLSTAQAIFRLTYSAIAMILPGIMIKTLGRGDTQAGLRYMVIILSALAAFGMIVSSLFVRERKYASVTDENYAFFSSLKNVFTNKSFIMYLFGLMFFFIGFNTMRTSINYYIEDIMLMGKGAITLASAMLFGVSAASFLPVNRLAKRYGYRRPMLIALIALMVISTTLFGLGKIFPVWMGFVFFALSGIPVAGASLIFPQAMLSEICAVEAEKTGQQIGGLFFGVKGFFVKMAFFISIAILPMILVAGTGHGFLDSLISKPTGVSRVGIYGTSVFSIINFGFSFIFFYLFKEEIVKEKKS